MHKFGFLNRLRYPKLISRRTLLTLIVVLNIGLVEAIPDNIITQGLPLFIQLFILINIFQLFIATVMILEVKKISLSKVWGRILSGNFVCMLLTTSIALLLNRLYLTSSIKTLMLIAFFFTFAVSMVILTIYYLIKPLIKRRIDVFKSEHITIYLISIVTSYFLIKILPYIEYPSFNYFKLLYALVFLYILMMVYFGYISLYISKSYEKLGFVHTAFIMPPIGTVSIGLMSFLIINVTKNAFNVAYYYISGIFICSAFTFIYYLLYIVEYPSLLDPKWKALMPFDIVKVASSITLAFISISLYFSSKENSSFTIYQIVSYGPLLVFLLIIFLAIVYMLGYNRVIGKSVGTKKKKETYAITDLLNFVASQFLRSDYLQDIWENDRDKYIGLKDQRKTDFEASKRRFDLSELDNITRNTLATAMLLDMQSLSAQNKDAIMTNNSLKALEKDIGDILQEEIFLLPDELRTNFDEEDFYPLLFEKLVNESAERIKAFVPSLEHQILFEKLSRVNDVFKDSTYDGEKIRIPSENKFSRAEFIDHFKSYLNSLEELFPFEEILLYESIKTEIKEKILNYGFSIEDLLDLVPTGIKKFDEITGGGLPRKTSTLILCEETRHKKKFLMSFVKEGLKDRDHIIFATSRDPSQVIWNELQKEFSTLKNLSIIDLYQDIHTSEKVSNTIEKKNRMIIPTSTVYLRQSIVKSIKKYTKDRHKRVVFDFYNDLSKDFHYNELSTIIFQNLDGLRRWNCSTLFTLDPSLITRENLEVMEKKFENVLVLSSKEIRETILIKKLQGGTPKRGVISFH